MKCDKCLTEAPEHTQYAYAGSDEMIKISLCRICDNALKEPLNSLPEFMKEDFGSYPVSRITKSIINARKERALGISHWKNL